MNENIRPTQNEIDTVVAGIAYNQMGYNSQLADARLVDLALAKPTAETALATETNGADGDEYDPATAAKKAAINAADAAAVKLHAAAAETIKKHPERTLLASRLNVKLLTGKPGNFSFTKEETDFIVTGLRGVEHFDIEGSRYTEVVMNAVVGTPTHLGSAYSQRQSQAERARLQTVRDDFLALFSKFIQYQRAFAATPETNNNDQ
jgi:hypothetical protein